MRPRVLKLLRDMAGAGTSIQSYVAGRTESDYLNEEMIRRAVERQFEIVGEALRLLLIEDPGIAGRISHATQVIAFRNVLAHGYGGVDDLTVWQNVRDRLPLLLAEVQALIANEEANP